MASIRQHEQSCRSVRRDPTVPNPGGPLGGTAFCLKRIADVAGPPCNRWYLVVWCHPRDPSAGYLPGDDEYQQWDATAADGPGYAPTWEHHCNVGKTAKRAIIAYFKKHRRPGFGPEELCEDSTINRCWFCNTRFDLRRELQEHKCGTRPLPRSGTKAQGTGRRVDWKLVHRDRGVPGQSVIKNATTLRSTYHALRSSLGPCYGYLGLVAAP